MFSSNNSGFGGFGSNTSSANNASNSSPFTGFGSTNNNSAPTFGQPQQNSTTSSFGAPSSLFFAISDNVGGFGSSSATPQTNAPAFGGFGQAAQSSNTGFGFGSSSTAAPAFGGNNMFGATTNSANSSSSFGNSTGTGLFGNAGTTSTFGSGMFSPSSNLKSTVTTGTANPPFAVQSEKEAGATNATNLFQSITCMPAYTNSSFEELRLQDYAQNRRYGSANASFGTATFGTTTSSNPFGSQPQSSPFGGNTFGQNSTPAPASGAFGSNSTTQNSGLFGQSSNPSPFGGNNTTVNTGNANIFGSNAATNNGPFGGNANNNATPPFGQNTNAFNPNSPFGSSNNNSTTPAFGNNNNTSKPSFTFGGANTQPSNIFNQNTSTPGSSGLFGNNAASTPSGSTGLFGQPSNPASTNATSGLFNNNNGAQNNSTGGFTFGGSNAANGAATSSSGFGAAAAGPIGGTPAPKPFTFGSSTPATGQTGAFGSLTNNSNQKPFTFGTPASNSQPSTNLFGQNGTSTGTTPSLFGNPPATGMFGGNSSSQDSSNQGNPFAKSTSNNLFAVGTQPQQNQSIFGSSSVNGATNPFGNSNNAQGAGSAGQATPFQSQAGLSVAGANPYGSNPLFSSMQGSPAQTLGPLATPLVPTPHKKKPAALPQFKNSVRSPMASPRSLYNQSSTHHASARTELTTRKPIYSFFDEELLLQTDAFSPRTGIKRLVIDRKGADSDLLTGAIDLTSKAEGPITSDQLQIKPVVTAITQSSPTNEQPSDPSASKESVKKSEPTKYQTENHVEETTSPDKQSTVVSDYWTSPSLASLSEYSKAQLSKVKDFKIGRHGYGQISFCASVDLSSLENVEDVAGKLVLFEGKMCTVYPDETAKPAEGKGLNVPAILTLENCFPLSKDKRLPIRDTEHPRFQQHVDRLKRMAGTQFIDYVADTGTWIFRVEHF